MLILTILSFLSGILTALAPCMLPLLPVLLITSLDKKDKKDYGQAFIIISSLLVSIFIFTLLLKYSTALINVPASFWSAFSGIMLIILGTTLFLPKIYEYLILKFNLQSKTQRLLSNSGKNKNGLKRNVLIGLALGPVFNSCSPVYSFILATALPASTINGLIYLLFYCLGLGFILVLITFFGRKITSKINVFNSQDGRLRRITGLVLIIFGVLISTGYIKKIEQKLTQSKFLQNNVKQESKLLKKIEQ
jgi:cytochrome c biogenesis protein CcdA